MNLIKPFVGNKVIDQSTNLLNTARDSIKNSNGWLSSLKANRDVVIAGLYLLVVETPVNLATTAVSVPATATVGLIPTFAKENQNEAPIVVEDKADSEEPIVVEDKVDSEAPKKPTLKERTVKVLQTISKKTQCISAQQLLQRAKRTVIVALTALASLVLMLLPFIPAGKISISLYEKAGLIPKLNNSSNRLFSRENSRGLENPFVSSESQTDASISEEVNDASISEEVNDDSSSEKAGDDSSSEKAGDASNLDNSDGA